MSSPRIWRTGIGPDQAVMMGDKEWTDIAPAKRRGFKTILYTGISAEVRPKRTWWWSVSATCRSSVGGQRNDG